MQIRQVGLFSALAGVLLMGAPLWGQNNPKLLQQTAESKQKASAYYHFALGHLHAELARSYRSQDDFQKAVDHYRKAIEADPEAEFIVGELTDLLLQANRWRDAVQENEALLRSNPDNIQARRILGHIYTRLIAGTTNPKEQEEYVRKGMEHYRYLTEKRPQDAEGWVRLGWLYRVSSNSLEAEKAFQKALELEGDNEGALGELAQLYASLKEYDRALASLEKIEDPSLNTLMLMANLYEEQHNYAKAAEMLERAASKAPDTGQIQFELARALTMSGQLDRARSVYDRLLAENPGNAELHLRISQILAQQQQFEAARAEFEKAKAIQPDNLEVLLHEVELLAAEGKLGQAATALESLLEKTKRDSYNDTQRGLRLQLTERLAIYYRLSNQVDKSVATFRKLLELDDSLAPRVAGQIIETYRGAKALDVALEEANQAVAQWPDNRMLVSIRASLLADMGRGAEGANDLRKFLGGEDDREVYLSMAQVYEKAKQYDNMAGALEKAWDLSESPDDKETVLFLRGVMYEKQKKYEQSEQAFLDLLKINPESASALNYLGYTLADRNVRLDQARKYVEKALELDPGNGAYLDSLGWVAYRQGQFDEAERYLRQALEKTSGDPVIYDHLGDVYMSQGRVKDAISQWEASLQEWEATPKSEYDPNQVSSVRTKLENARVRVARETPNGPKNKN